MDSCNHQISFFWAFNGIPLWFRRLESLFCGAEFMIFCIINRQRITVEYHLRYCVGIALLLWHNFCNDDDTSERRCYEFVLYTYLYSRIIARIVGRHSEKHETAGKAGISFRSKIITPPPPPPLPHECSCLLHTLFINESKELSFWCNWCTLLHIFNIVLLFCWWIFVKRSI